MKPRVCAKDEFYKAARLPRWIICSPSAILALILAHLIPLCSMSTDLVIPSTFFWALPFSSGVCDDASNPSGKEKPSLFVLVH